MKRLTLSMIAAGFIATAAIAADLPFIEVDPASKTSFRERDTGKPFVSVGLNYFDPQTGWAPKIWQQFDETRVREHLDLVAQQGFNTIRVFITLASFETEAGKLSGDGLPKFRKLLDLCRERGIYVIPTGPELWEGAPVWYGGDRFADERLLTAEESWWREFAGTFAGDPAIMAWDLANEPTVTWKTPAMHERWNHWLKAKYGTRAKIAEAWKLPVDQVEQLQEAGNTGAPAATSPAAGSTTDAENAGISIPPNKPARGDLKLLDYQRFREHVGGEWVRRMTQAIRSADRNHMVTVGHIQWASPVLLPSVWHYAGFNLKAETRYVDFTSIHFYPLDHPRPCDSAEGIPANAIYLQAVLHDCSVGKPVMLGEFNWYGGGGLMGSSGWELPEKPVEHQVEWCGELLAVSRGRLCGWLNWAFADTPTSRDISRWSGCWTTDLELKPWGARAG